MKLYILRMLAVLAVLVGVPVNLFLLFLLTYFSEISLPVSPSQFGNLGSFTGLPEEGDQMIGGGYSFAEARDIWIRIRLDENSDYRDFEIAEIQKCSPEDLELFRAWFLTQTQKYQQSQLNWPSLNDKSPDQTVLNDIANLDCRTTAGHSMPLLHRYGEFPKACDHGWRQYHKPSGFYYRRFYCHH